MKTALCLSGLIRDFATSGHTYNKFIAEPLGATIFIHTWRNTNEPAGTRFAGSSGSRIENKKDFFKNIFPNNEVILEEEIYPPQDVLTSPRTSAIMYYTIHQANELKKKYEKENNFKFDLVIRARMDFFLESQLPYEEVSAAIENKKIIYTGINLLHKGRESGRNNWNYSGKYGVDDQFIFGSSPALDIVCDTFLNRTNLHNKSGELLLGEQLSDYNISPLRTSYRFKALRYLRTEESVYWEDYKKDTEITMKRKCV